MPAQGELYAVVVRKLQEVLVGEGVRITTVRRLALGSESSRRPPTPQPARESLFTLGLRIARRWLARTSRPSFLWLRSHLAAPSWASQWRQTQSHRLLFARTVPL